MKTIDDACATIKSETATLESTISALTAENAALKEELRPHRFKFGDATRKQFLGAPFSEAIPGSYEAAFYPSSVAEAARPTTPISRTFVAGTTMPGWRADYPNALHWFGDVEWQNPGGITASEVALILPGFQGARDFATKEAKGLKLSGYGFPPRFGVDKTDAVVRAQVEIVRPILDLLDECLLTLYPIYTDLAKSREYIRRNIAMAREAMPGKRVVVLGWDTWHNNVGAPLAGTPLSREWQRMFLEEVYAGADAYAPWLKAAAPKPTTEPWWVETQAWLKAIGRA